MTDLSAEPRFSRGTLLRGGAALVAGAALMGTAGAPAAFASEGVQPRRIDPNPGFHRARATRMANLTGPGITSRFDADAMDLGCSARTPDGRILFVFGDTFAQARVGSDDWRAPTGLFADGARPLSAGIQWTGAVGGQTAQQLIPYSHSGEFSTALPGDIMTIGDTMYLWLMLNAGYGNVIRSQIYVSTDNGETWRYSGAEFPGDQDGGLFQQITWAPADDGYVYLYCSGFQRDKPIIMYRVPQGSVTEPSAYQPWGYAAGAWGWGNAPTPILGGEFGEMSLRPIGGKWIFTWFNSGLYRIDCLIFDSPTSNLYTAFHETLLWGCDWGKEDDQRVAQLYGPYVIPGSTLDDLYLAVSQWNTAAGWPYHAQQFRFQGLGDNYRSAAG